MKTMPRFIINCLLTLTFICIGMSELFAQTRGIPYQAYILSENTSSVPVPGKQMDLPITNSQLVFQFVIKNENGDSEYIERKTITTDEYGMVSCVVGIGGTEVIKTFDNIKWDGTPKKMYISIDFSGTGMGFQEYGEMDIIYIPNPGGVSNETLTQLVNNNDGSFSYFNELGDVVTFSVPQHNAGDPNTLGVRGQKGNLYVDEDTGNIYMYGETTWVAINTENQGLSTSTGAPSAANPANPQSGDIYVDESTGDLYTYNGTEDNTWENQSVTLANNGLTVDINDNKLQLGGNLIKPTTITSDPVNTLAIDGLQTTAESDDYDIATVDNTTGVLKKIPASSLAMHRYIKIYTANDGDILFKVPKEIKTTTDFDKIDVYRNGVSIDFFKVDVNTIRLDLGGLGGCYAGDEIRIVQIN